MERPSCGWARSSSGPAPLAVAATTSSQAARSQATSIVATVPSGGRRRSYAWPMAGFRLPTSSVAPSHRFLVVNALGRGRIKRNETYSSHSPIGTNGWRRGKLFRIAPARRGGAGLDRRRVAPPRPPGTSPLAIGPERPAPRSLSKNRPRREDARRERGRESNSPAERPVVPPASWRNRLPTPFWQRPPEAMPVLGQAPRPLPRAAAIPEKPRAITPDAHL